MTRPSDFTRERILKSAVQLFAQKGYDGASVRTIVARRGSTKRPSTTILPARTGFIARCWADSFRALTQSQMADAENLKGMSREDALRQFVRRQLRPLTSRDELSRRIQIFNWEGIRPTAVFRKFLSEEAAPFMGVATDLVRRFLPEADHRSLVLAAIWLMGQCSVFVRNREQLAGPPTDLALDERSVDWLAETISRWAIGGLAQPA